MLALDDFEDLDEEQYWERLEQAAAWMEEVQDEEELISPGTWQDEIVSFSGDADNPVDPADKEKRYTPVEDVLEQRERTLGSVAYNIDVEEVGGRVVAVYIDRSLGDGAGRAVSEEFLGDEYRPPTDTWIAYTVEEVDPERFDSRDEGFLLCYVPEEYVENVQAGMDVDPVDSLDWVWR